MILKVEITTDNDAFTQAPGEEVARLLKHAAREVKDWHGANAFSLGLYDYDGNKVGSVWSEAQYPKD